MNGSRTWFARLVALTAATALALDGCGSSPSSTGSTGGDSTAGSTGGGSTAGSSTGTGGHGVEEGSTFAIAPSPAADPAVAWGGSEYLVVWTSADASADLLGARVTATGAVLDEAPLVISQAAGPQTRPAVTWSGTSFLVAWIDGRSPAEEAIYAARVNTDGSRPDGDGVRVSPPGQTSDSVGAVSAASSGSSTLVVWNNRLSSSEDGIVGVRVSEDAQALGGPIQIAPGTSSIGAKGPFAVSNGKDWLVAWDCFGCLSGEGGSSARLVGADGTPGAGPTWFSAGLQPSGAWSGDSWLMATALAGFQAAVEFNRFTPGGTPVSASSLAAGPPGSLHAGGPSVTFVGSNFELSWLGRLSDLDAVSVLGRSVSASGTPLGASPAVLFMAPALSDQVSAAGDGQRLLVFVSNGALDGKLLSAP